jgi:putative ABC transport system substrate-binding protein
MCLFLFAFLMAGVPAGAQSPVYQVAVLTPGLTFSPVLEGLREGLAHLGYQEGRNVTLIVEDAKGESSDLAQRAARLAAAKPHVLVTVATAQTAAAKQATTTIPIVFAWVGDPVKSGFIASYSSSENNLTGVSNQAAALSGKRLEILLEAVPGIRRILTIVAAKEDIAQKCFQSLSESASQRGIQIIRRDVSSREEIQRALRELPKGAMDAIVHVPSTLVGIHIDLLIQRAKEDRIPVGVHEDTLVKQGALLSYGPEFRTIGVQTAKVVVKVLKGTKPSELPIQTPEKLVLAMNLTTAKAIGLKLPRLLMERADRLLE